MGKFFNKDKLNFKMAKMAFTKPENFEKIAQVKPTNTEHHSNFADEKSYVKNLTKFFKASGDPDAETSAKKYSTTNPWTAAPQGSAYKVESKYKDAVVAYYKPGSKNSQENDKKVSSYLTSNPWKAAGIADPSGAKYAITAFQTAAAYNKAIEGYYGEAGSKDPVADMKKYVDKNPWNANHLKKDDSSKKKGDGSKQKDDSQKEEEGKGGDMDMGKEEGRGKDKEDFDKALDSPYAGAGRADVYRAVRRARMSKMFNKLRKAIGRKRAKDIMNRSEMVMRERKELVRSEFDRMDQGDPNSVVSMVYEGPESQARYEEGAKKFKSQLETLKVSHFPSGGSGIKELD